MRSLRPALLTAAITFTLANNASAQFGPEQSMFVEGPETVDLVDLDQDGDKDLLIGSRGGILYYENIDGLGTWAPMVIIGTGTESRAHVTDFDGNGNLDILASRELNGGVVWFQNLGNLGWSLAYDVVPNATAADLGSADLDGDGDLDPFFVLAINQLAWCENTDGQGTMSMPVAITPVYNNAKAQALDVDDDNDLDLVWSVRIPEEMGWCQNMGSSFSSAQPISADRKGRLTDVDGDGRADLVSSSTLAGSLDWQRGINGQLGFDPMSNVGLGISADQVLVMDLDNDGDRDVAVANDATDEIGWYENIDGQGTFGTMQVVAYGVDNAHVIVGGDINGDGDPEFFAGSAAQNRVVWYDNLEYAQLMIGGRVFHDHNADGQFNGNDFGIFNTRVDLSDGRSTFTNHSGMYWFSASPGNYSVSVAQPAQWSLTSTGNLGAIVSSPNGSAMERNFGMQPNTALNEFNAFVTSGPITCSQTIPYFLYATNTGNQMRDLRMTFQLDAISSFNSADPMPTSINGNTLIWDFAAVQPSHIRQVEVRVNTASASYLGTLMNDVVTAEARQNGQVLFTTTYAYHPMLMCAYDPNDKQVLPTGTGNQHVTPMETTLDYTVRFMNTGNLPATDVVIVDQLDANLDPSTLHIVGSSHAVHVVLEANGIVRFEHMGINLPDSGSNYVGSQGYVRFTIRPLSALPEGTVVENTAEIYFDNNPAIVTNTVFNTFADGATAVNDFEVDGEATISVRPNPAFDMATIHIGSAFIGRVTIDVYNEAGQKVIRLVRLSNTLILHREDMPAGVYYLHATDEVGRQATTRLVWGQ